MEGDGILPIRFFCSIVGSRAEARQYLNPVTCQKLSGAPGEIRTSDPLLRSRLSTFIKTCRSERKAGENQQVVTTSGQLLAPSSSPLRSDFATICHNLVLRFYDRENRGYHQDIVHGIYFGLFENEGMTGGVGAKEIVMDGVFRDKSVLRGNCHNLRLHRGKPVTGVSRAARLVGLQVHEGSVEFHHLHILVSHDLGDVA